MTNLQFNLPKGMDSIIKVIGVGGGGSNAVNHMFRQGIIGVNFVVCNTDSQALEISPVPSKIQLGPSITSGLGAGSNPEVGRLACEESEESIRAVLGSNTRMVFITAGMGGGTGTGAAPVVARIARELNILSVGIVTTPFSYEGSRKLSHANEGIEKMKQYVDTILVISNDKLREMYAALKRSEAFAIANNILATAAKSISEIITVPGEVNVDFADVAHVMRNSGVAIMGVGMAEGSDRAIRAVQSALNSPLLNDNDIRGARKVLINISSGTEEMSIDEIDTIMAYVKESADSDADIIFGTVDDNNLKDNLAVTIIATGFDESNLEAKREARIVSLHEESKKATSHVLDMNSNSKANSLFDEVPSAQELYETPSEPTSNVEEFEINNQKEELPDSLQFEVKYAPSENVTPIQKSEPDFNSFFQPQNNAVENTGNPSNPADFSSSEKTLSERKNRLKELSLKNLSNESSLHELESVPAYMRRQVKLDNLPHSSESELSKFSLGSTNVQGVDRPKISDSNSFLADAVD